MFSFVAGRASPGGGPGGTACPATATAATPLRRQQPGPLGSCGRRRAAAAAAADSASLALAARSLFCSSTARRRSAICATFCIARFRSARAAAAAASASAAAAPSSPPPPPPPPPPPGCFPLRVAGARSAPPPSPEEGRASPPPPPCGCAAASGSATALPRRLSLAEDSFGLRGAEASDGGPEAEAPPPPPFPFGGEKDSSAEAASGLLFLLCSATSAGPGWDSGVRRGGRGWVGGGSGKGVPSATKPDGDIAEGHRAAGGEGLRGLGPLGALVLLLLLLLMLLLLLVVGHTRPWGDNPQPTPTHPRLSREKLLLLLLRL